MNRDAMSRDTKMIAAIQGAPGTVVQELLHAFVTRWQPSTRISGVIEDGYGHDDHACGAAYLLSIASGTRYPMFQDLGQCSSACRIDPVGVVLAGEAVRRDIAAGCDLVVLNRFGKLEAGREGLMSAFVAAVEAGVPVLTSVSPAFQEAWERFAAPLFVMLPADGDAIEAWWQAVRADALLELPA